MTSRILATHPRGPAVGTVIAFHGFTRSPEDLQALAQACTDRGLTTLRPALGALYWPHSTNNAAHLSGIAGMLDPLVDELPCVVVGHSAGASAGSWVAAELLRLGCDVRGLVFVDGVEGPTRLMHRAWPLIGRLRIRAVCAPPSRCNRHGQLSDWLAAQTGDVVCEVVPGSGHGDIEGEPRAIYRWACGDTTDGSVRRTVLERTMSCVDDVLSGR
jgi:pimeloyl-ACP methyl ester carboxylesterase